MAKKKSGKSKTTKPRQTLTAKQSAFVIAFIRTQQKNKAALLALYSPKHPDQSGYQAFQAIQKKVPDIMDRMGLTVPALIEKHLVPLLNAKTVKMAQDEGIFTDVVALDDNGSQLTALDIAFKLHGAYAAKEQIIQKASTVRAIIVDMPRPKKPPELEENVTNGHKPQK